MTDLFSDAAKVERILAALPTLTAQGQTVLADLELAIKRAQEFLKTLQEAVQ